MTPRGRRPERVAARAVVPAVLAGLLTGCGIEPTSVPVDAGAAPSRVACTMPGGDTATVPDGPHARIFLVCGSRIAPVRRAVHVPTKQIAAARTLLAELTEPPTPQEASAGFVSPVPGELDVTGGTVTDPTGALRLSRPLGELPPFVLAQLVCTYAKNGAASPDGTILLGGPADGPEDGLRRFTCDSTLLNNPQSAVGAGAPVPDHD